jgi:hypothetical protein
MLKLSFKIFGLSILKLKNGNKSKRQPTVFGPKQEKDI